MYPQSSYMQTRTIRVGGKAHLNEVFIGGAHPVVIQTMWEDKLEQVTDSVVERIRGLEQMGARLLRFAVPDLQAADILGELAQTVSLPLVADIHFDYNIALRILDFPIAKVRINPGNIGNRERVLQILDKAGAAGVPIRIGVNAGSLPIALREQVDKGELSGAEALVRAAESELAICDEAGFKDVAVSMKASNVPETIDANRLFSSRFDIPLHIGVTEAGPLAAGLVRNTAALYTLLREGIGDTVRISLSDSIENEVIAAREILGAVAETVLSKGDGGSRCGGIRGVRIVSCPRCGRCVFDTHAFTARWLNRLYMLRKDITVAVMGCPVNGLEEARHADLGITGSGRHVLIFQKGKVVHTISIEDADRVFEDELYKL